MSLATGQVSAHGQGLAEGHAVAEGGAVDAAKARALDVLRRFGDCGAFAGNGTQGNGRHLLW